MRQAIKYDTGEEIEIGDRILEAGRPAVVVAVIGSGKFSGAYPADAWAYLEEGLLIMSDRIGLVHCPDADDLKLVSRG